MALPISTSSVTTGPRAASSSRGQRGFSVAIPVDRECASIKSSRAPKNDCCVRPRKISLRARRCDGNVLADVKLYGGKQRTAGRGDGQERAICKIPAVVSRLGFRFASGVAGRCACVSICFQATIVIWRIRVPAGSPGQPLRRTNGAVGQRHPPISRFAAGRHSAARLSEQPPLS